DFFFCKSIHSRCDFFCLRAIVHEHQRRLRCADVLEHERCNSRPHTSANVAEVWNRRLNPDLHFLREPAVHNGYLPELRLMPDCFFASTKESSDFVEWALRCRQTD